MSSLFCIDTSVLIESWWNLYRPQSFPLFWRRLEAAIDDGRVMAPRIVLDELERRDDVVYGWARQHDKLFRPLTADLQIAQASIINRFPMMIDGARGRSMGDPWVIGLAQLCDGAVVSQEGPGKLQKPKIPDVCRSLGLGHLKVADFIERMNWVF